MSTVRQASGELSVCRPLSPHERRCLLKHICECHELLQLTLLGAASVQDRAAGAEHVVRIQQALVDAELQVARAEQLALLLLNVECDCQHAPGASRLDPAS
jgi:hypothetical protein